MKYAVITHYAECSKCCNDPMCPYAHITTYHVINTNEEECGIFTTALEANNWIEDQYAIQTGDALTSSFSSS